jgi:YesN/AraC family two-component response regulator
MIKVLIIDDEPLIRLNLNVSLEDEGGFDVYEAATASASLSIISHQKQFDRPIDIAIVDIRLPDLDGESLIERMLQIQPSLAIIIHTGSTEFELPDNLISFGLTKEHILFKPITDFSQLTNKLINLTSNGS